MNNWYYNNQEFSGVLAKTTLDKEYEFVVLVGPHASGKTHCFNSLKQSLDPKKFNFPTRLTSRPVRLNEDVDENEFRTAKEINEQDLLVTWKRSVADSKDELYGFRKQDGDKITVLSANNGIFTSMNSESSTVKFFNSLVVCVYAPLEVRQTRILDMTPDLRSEERYRRLKESISDTLPESDILVLNFEPFIETTGDALIELVQKVCG